MSVKPRRVPCGSCPYRKDCPSGVWREEGYLKLAEYDRETFNQPLGVFLCHTEDLEDDVLCRGWCEVHGSQDHGHELLSARFAGIDLSDIEPSGVALHDSGVAACDAGLREIDSPSDGARDLISKLLKIKRIKDDPRNSQEDHNRPPHLHSDHRN